MFGNLPSLATDAERRAFNDANLIAVYAAGPASGPTILQWSRSPTRIIPAGKRDWMIHAIRWVTDVHSARRIHADASAVLGVYGKRGKLDPKTSAGRVRRAIDGAAQRLRIPCWSHDTLLTRIREFA